MCIIPITYRCGSTGHITLPQYESRIYHYPSPANNVCACPTILFDRSGHTQPYDCPTCQAVRRNWDRRERVMGMVHGAGALPGGAVAGGVQVPTMAGGVPDLCAGAPGGGVPGLRPVQRPQGINSGRNTAIQGREIVTGLDGGEAEEKRVKRKREEEVLGVYGTRSGSDFQSNPTKSNRRMTPHPVPANMMGGKGGEKGTTEQGDEAGGGELSGHPRATPVEEAGDNGDMGVRAGVVAGTGVVESNGGAGVEDEDEQSLFFPE